MKISNTMSLSELAQRMGDAATEAEARAMRDVLVGAGHEETAEIGEAEWSYYLHCAVLTAKVETVDPAAAR